MTGLEFPDVVSQAPAYLRIGLAQEFQGDVVLARGDRFEQARKRGQPLIDRPQRPAGPVCRQREKNAACGTRHSSSILHRLFFDPRYSRSPDPVIAADEIVGNAPPFPDADNSSVSLSRSSPGRRPLEHEHRHDGVVRRDEIEGRSHGFQIIIDPAGRILFRDESPEGEEAAEVVGRVGGRFEAAG